MSYDQFSIGVVAISLAATTVLIARGLVEYSFHVHRLRSFANARLPAPVSVPRQVDWTKDDDDTPCGICRHSRIVTGLATSLRDMKKRPYTALTCTNRKVLKMHWKANPSCLKGDDLGQYTAAEQCKGQFHQRRDLKPEEYDFQRHPPAIGTWA